MEEGSQAKAPKRKPARKQVEAPVTGYEERHDPATFNIWTGRKLREYRDRDRDKRPREASKYRCLPQLDSGWTRGEAMDVSYCCLYFARGLCHHGSDCNYLHRVPTQADEIRHGADYGHDIFGRERGPANQDGRKKGVGSYERECRTLYVHYGGAGPMAVLELRKLLEENFGEWGPMEDIHVVPNKTIAFVRYSWRSSAEFAKVAMHQQHLLGSSLGEVLDVRWANDDPNPRAVVRVKREREEAFRDAYLQAVMDLPPEQKQARLMQLNLLANVRPGATTSAYPDTDALYEAGVGYSHDYQGWDAIYYSQPQPGSAAAYNEQGGEQEEREEGGVVQHTAVEQRQHAPYYPQQHGYYYPAQVGRGDGAGGAVWEGEDDVSRYLPPEEWEQPPAAQPAGDAGPAAAVAGWYPQQQQQEQQGAGGPAGVEGQAAEGQGPARDASGQVEQQGDVRAGPPAVDAAAQALGLIGGYGSGSDDEG